MCLLFLLSAGFSRLGWACGAIANDQSASRERLIERYSDGDSVQGYTFFEPRRQVDTYMVKLGNTAYMGCRMWTWAVNKQRSSLAVTVNQTCLGNNTLAGLDRWGPIWPAFRLAF